MKPNPYESPSESTNAPHDTTHPQMSCPECGKQMEPGYFPSSGGIHWKQPDEQSVSFLLSKCLPGTLGFWKVAKMGGFRCPDCELVVFRFGKHKLQF